MFKLLASGFNPVTRAALTVAENHTGSTNNGSPYRNAVDSRGNTAALYILGALVGGAALCGVGALVVAAAGPVIATAIGIGLAASAAGGAVYYNLPSVTHARDVKAAQNEVASLTHRIEEYGSLTIGPALRQQLEQSQNKLEGLTASKSFNEKSPRGESQDQAPAQTVAADNKRNIGQPGPKA